MPIYICKCNAVLITGCFTQLNLRQIFFGKEYAQQIHSPTQAPKRLKAIINKTALKSHSLLSNEIKISQLQWLVTAQKTDSTALFP